MLLGFPGAGKTTIAKKLANVLRCDYVDLDQELESYYKTNIPIFMSKYGESTFRKCEYDRLKKMLLKPVEKNLIISTGGGTPCFFDAIDLINEHATSIYVKMSEKSLFVRLTNAKKKRPLLQGMNNEDLEKYVHEMLALREPFYEKAKIVVKGENFNVDELVKIISDEVEGHLAVSN